MDIKGEERIVCCWRRVTGRCMKRAIEEVDWELAQKKQQCQKLIKWQEQVATRLERQKVDEWWQIELENELEHLDEQVFDQKSHPKKKLIVAGKGCPYQKYDCQNVYEMKGRVRQDYGNRWLDLKYAAYQWVNLIRRVKKAWQMGEREGTWQVARFENSVLGPSFTLIQQKTADEISFLFCYWKKDERRIQQSEMKGRLQANSEVTYGTLLAGKQEGGKWVAFEVDEKLDHEFMKLLLKSVHQMLHKEKKRWRASNGYLEGCYITLSSYPLSLQKKWIHSLKALDYKPVGRINTLGQFEPEQYLVRIEKA